MKITIGGFDGMHIAHMELLKRSDAYLVIEKNPSLTPLFERLSYKANMLDLLPLNEIKELSKDEFIEKLKNYNVKEIIIGYDFRFGKNRSGNIEDLKKYFKVEIINEIKLDGIGVHSKIIRHFIENNKIKTANKFLGHLYKIRGIKINGQGLGSKYLVPTINIKLFYDYTLPQGVFLSKTNGYYSLTFIGVRSTDENFAIETHILENFDNKIEREIIEIEFLDFLRENRKFSNIIELKNQIISDKKEALNIIKKYYTKNHAAKS